MATNPATDITFPSQKKSKAQKGTTWRKDCVNGGEHASLWRSEGLRQSYYNKRINYDLYSDILDQSDVEKICNPMGILGMNSPAKMQNYPVCNPKIDLLVGESISRKFDWKVRVINDDAISEKEDALREKLMTMITAHIQGKGVNPEDQKAMETELKKFQEYRDYEYQDMRERVATQILTYLYKHLKLDYLFAQGFKDALICAEEIYQCDIIAKEPIVRRLNPLNVHTVRSGESNKIEDADIITIMGYMSPGQIVDEYHDFLKPREIDMVENGMDTDSAGSAIDIGRYPDLPLKMDDSIEMSVLSNDLAYGSPFDNNGNIRVIKVYWKSMRKMLKVKYYDEQGDVQYDLFDEDYKIDKTKGEEAETIWISEWWEGHKIGGTAATENDDRAIYCKMRPRPVQFRSMENPSKCHPGIVGQVYNTNDNDGVSLMDRMKPYQYIYNILAYNTELMVAKNRGKIMRVNVAEIPEKWDADMWLSFAQGMNVAFYDPFKEGTKGASQGKMVGSMGAGQAPVIDMEMGNSIQLYLDMMNFIKYELGEIAGVSASRQGQIHQRQAVSNTETELTQSSHITEYWFMEHDQVKLRVLECLLETAKHAWKDKHNKKMQHVLDDGATMLLDTEVDQFNECEYGLQVTNGAKSYELLQTMKQLAHAGIQNGLLKFSQLLDIYSTDSMASIRRKLVRAEKEAEAQQQENEARNQEMQREQFAHEHQAAEALKDFQREEWDREDARNTEDNETKLSVERMRQDNETSRFHREDPNGNEIKDLEKLQQDAKKISDEYRIKKAAQDETARHNKKTEEQKDKEIAIKKKQANKPASSAPKK